MISSKQFNTVSIIVIILAVCITVLFMNGEALGMKAVVDEDAEANEESSSEYFSKNDLDGDWYKDKENITKIVLSGSDIRVSGSGAYAYNGDVVISKTGWYEISGTLDDGSITVDADSSSKVWIVLDNASVYASDDAALRVDQAEKVFLTLADGSVNTLECGNTMSDAAKEDNTDGAVFAHDDLTINGSGELNIVSGYEHGIKAKDSLKICGGTISIKANADGIHVNDHFKLTDAFLTIDAMDDGICSETDLTIVSGKILISDCYEGIESPQITVLDGDIEIHPSDDGFNANGGDGGFGNFGFFGKDNSTDTGSDNEEETADPCITIYGGNIKILNPSARDADGMDSNKDIFIYGGNIFISLAGGGTNNGIDYGSESGGVCEIYGGTVISCGGSSMVEQFDDSSTQASILYNLSNTTEDNVNVTLKDEDGNVILESEIPSGFNSIQLSCPEMKVGSTYTLKIGDTEEEISLESVTTTVGTTSGFGNFGGGGFGGFDGSKMPTPSDGMELPDMSEMPSMPGGGGFPGKRGMRPGSDGNSESTENSDDGESRMQRPDFGNNDTDGERTFERPDDESTEGNFEKNFDRNFAENSENSDEEETESVSKAKALSEYDNDIWKYIAASVIVLASAVVAVRSFKRW